MYTSVSPPSMKLYFWDSCWQKIQLSSNPPPFFCLCLIFVASLCSHSACQHYPHTRARMLIHRHYLIQSHTHSEKNKLEQKNKKKKKNRANERQLWVLADTMSSSYCKRNWFCFYIYSLSHNEEVNVTIHALLTGQVMTCPGIFFSSLSTGQWL